MNVLVTGANGFVGKALCEALLENGHRVIAIYRSQQKVRVGVSPHFISDINASTDWSEVLSNVDVVVHLAARVHVMNDIAENPLMEFRKINVDASLNLANQAILAGVKRFIYLSSIKVNGEFTLADKPFTETDIANPQDAYAISKHEAELALWGVCQHNNMELVIIRPPLIYGAGVKANFANMMRVVKRGVPLPLGKIHNQRSFIYVNNLTSLIIRCVEHTAAANQLFLASDNCDLSTTDLLTRCAKALAVKSRLIPIPQKMIEMAAAMLGKRDFAQRLCGNLQVNSAKARNLLAWQPPFTIDQGLKATAMNFDDGK
jgi:nucleoside-diphosphate-sugar epimerase